MSNYNPYRFSKIVSSSANTEYSGSIQKIHVIGAGTILGGMFGDPARANKTQLSGTAFDNDNIGTFGTLNFADTHSLTIIDGPIGRVKIGTAACLLYFADK